jgi:pyruvate formate lyase activating enzyme
MERYKQNSELGLISRIQKYSLKDGPGIRTTVFLKGCSMHCSWCSNPELIRPAPEILSNRAICIQCGGCFEVCPEGAIQLIDGDYLIEASSCNECGLCVEKCPVCARELIGRWIPVDQLFLELMKDQVFYATSGGGVTFSGGEPALHPKFVKRVAQKLQENRIHVALDTSGNVPWECYHTLFGHIDLILFDFKFMDEEKHQKYTGVSNKLILSNANKISALGVPMIARLIILPGLNDTATEIERKILFLQQLESVIQIDILPYHKLGLGKYPMLGKEYPLEDLEPPNREGLEKLKSIFQLGGFQVTIGGS